MRVKLDKESDVLYVRIDESEIVESEEVEPGIILDFSADGRVVGIEVLGLSSRTKTKEKASLIPGRAYTGESHRRTSRDSSRGR